jgi:hypothetical protein
MDLEKDILSSDISEKCKHSNIYCQNLYAALCNNTFLYNQKEWGCSWRHSGSIISKLLNSGDYIDWYCSGIECDPTSGYVEEGVITEEIKLDFIKLGWVIKQ